MPRPHRARLLGLSFLCLLLAGVTVGSVGGLRWRAEVIGLKAAGKIPDIGWLELARMLPPRGAFYLEPLRRSRNPYLVITTPYTSAADLASGAEEYRSNCATCHGLEGRGNKGPPLVGTLLKHGGSDWARYRAITHGIAGTGMRAFQELTDRDRWRIVAYVSALGGNFAGADSGTAPSAPELERLRSITAADLVAARRDSADWLSYSGAYDGWRYSTLAQVNQRNVGRLRLLWMYQIVGGPQQRFETSPLVVDGMMFITTPDDGVRALDAETGSVLWSYDPVLPGDLVLCCGKTNRGLAILGKTLYLGTLDARLVALDARTGAVRWEVTAVDPAQGYSFTSAPLVVKDLVVIGSAGGEYATRGFIDAYEAETGRRRWRFYTIPEAGAPGSNTWTGNSWKTGGAPPWLTGSYDPALDLIYWGVGNPNPDFDGRDRLGDNLYSNSVVALEAATGGLRWYFQFTPHDEHDWDAAQIPVLVNPPEPDARPLLLWGNRNAFYYRLDRGTGRHLGAREFARQSWTDGIDSTGRPMVRAGSAPSREGTMVSPSATGATNWWSPTYSPRTGTFYLQVFERDELYFRVEGPANGTARLGGAWGRTRPGDGQVVIRALDALTGERRWEREVVTGSGEFPAVGGLLSTAGDLVFGGGDDVVLALDARSGRRLWSFKAGGGVNAAPVTYLVRGRQRVTVAAGRALLTFGIE